MRGRNVRYSAEEEDLIGGTHGASRLLCLGGTHSLYSVLGESPDHLLAGRHFGMKVCYLRGVDRVFGT